MTLKLLGNCRLLSNFDLQCVYIYLGCIYLFKSVSYNVTEDFTVVSQFVQLTNYPFSVTLSQILSLRTLMRKDCWLGSLPSLLHQSLVLPSSQKVAVAAPPDSFQVLRWRQPLSPQNLLGLNEYGLCYHLFILQDTISTDSGSSDLSLPPFVSFTQGSKMNLHAVTTDIWYLAVPVLLYFCLFWGGKWATTSYRVIRVFIFTRGHPLRLLSVVWRWSSPLREEYMTGLWEKQWWIDTAQNMYSDTSIPASSIKRLCCRP